MAEKEVGLACWQEVAQSGAFRSDLNVGQNWSGNNVFKPCHSGIALGGMCHDKMIAAGEVAETFEEVPIDTGPNAKWENVGAICFVFDEVKDFGFSIDVAVGNEHQRAGAIAIVRKFESFLESIQEAGSSGAISAVQEVEGAVDVGLIGLQ